MTHTKDTDGFELRASSEKGEGIFASRSFQAGEIVMVGVIEKTVDENHSHASQVGENKYVLHAGLISKVNHSCEPNCGIGLNKTGAHNFVARKDISPDEEITFDYAMRNYTIDYFPYKCMCGSEKCRCRITGWKDLPDTERKSTLTAQPPICLKWIVRNRTRTCRREIGSRRV
jgi:hypothetical protein